MDFGLLGLLAASLPIAFLFGSLCCDCFCLLCIGRTASYLTVSFNDFNNCPSEPDCECPKLNRAWTCNLNTTIADDNDTGAQFKKCIWLSDEVDGECLLGDSAGGAKVGVWLEKNIDNDIIMWVGIGSPGAEWGNSTTFGEYDEANGNCWWLYRKNLLVVDQADCNQFQVAGFELVRAAAACDTHCKCGGGNGGPTVLGPHRGKRNGIFHSGPGGSGDAQCCAAFGEDPVPYVAYGVVMTECGHLNDDDDVCTDLHCQNMNGAYVMGGGTTDPNINTHYIAYCDGSGGVDRENEKFGQSYFEGQPYFPDETTLCTASVEFHYIGGSWSLTCISDATSGVCVGSDRNLHMQVTGDTSHGCACHVELICSQ